jgi:segregation and condensation protein B
METSLERDELKYILESMLFASELPIQLRKFHELFPEIALKDLKDILEELKEDYESLHRSFCLREVANGYQLCTKPEYSGWIKKLRGSRPLRFTAATMETLAIIAYKQPITRAEIEEIRGVDTSGTLRTLLEKRLIKISGKQEVPGKPLLYSTTPNFMTVFGLKGLKDLPALEDVEQLSGMSLPLPLFDSSPEQGQEE